ncbi:MAG: hypothetical protein AABX73_00995 [Nanoarchaeota archaeon]
MKKEMKIALFILVAFPFLLSFKSVNAVSVDVSDYSSTLKIVDISSASNIYGYEVNFSIDSGSVSGITGGNFLGPTTEATYGSSQRGGYLYVYGTRLDSAKTGVSGSGSLFNISYSGGLTLKGACLIDTSASSSCTSYNLPSSTTTSTTSTTTSETPTGTSAETISITSTPEGFEFNVIIDKKETKEITIKNNGKQNVFLSLSTENLEDIISFKQRAITIAAGQEQTIEFDVLVNKNSLYVGKILIKSGNTLVGENPVIINVKSGNFLFDSKISLSREDRTISLGENINAQIDLQQVGAKEKVDVVATYIIKDFSGNTYLEESETFFVLEEKSYIKELFTEDIPIGKYIAGLEITYPGAFAISSVQFKIIEKESVIVRKFSNNSIIIAVIIIVAIFLMLVIAITRMMHKKQPLTKRKNNSKI